MGETTTKKYVWIIAAFMLCGAKIAHATTENPGDTKGPALPALASQMEELYSAQFGLDAEGVPTVTIGLMDGQQRISFTPLQQTQAVIYNAQGQPRLVTLRRGQRYTVTLTQGQAADVHYALVGFSLRSSDWGFWQSRVNLWKQRGFQIKQEETGSIFAIRGRLFDNRRRLGILGYEERAFRARLRASQISERFQTNVHVRTQLLTRPSGKFLLSGDGQRWRSLALIELRTSGGIVQVERVEFGRGYAWHRFVPRTYRGSLLFTADQNGQMALINRIPLPAYLAGLLAAEMPLHAPLEALKAQSVCARNEILAKIGTRHRADPYLFCAHTHCQVYTGIHPSDAQISSIVAATRGEVMLTTQGYLADASYSAVCGGHSEHNEHVWGDHPRPALRGKPDTHSPHSAVSHGITEQNIRSWLQFPPNAYCRASSGPAAKKFRWTSYLRHDQIQWRIHRRYPIGYIRGIFVRKRGISGRVNLLQIMGSTANVMVRGELRIRRLFGNLNSSMFVVEPVMDASQRMLGWRFTGGGWGHGVGMCQYGAMGRARSGFSYQQILHHYFSNVSLVKLYP